MRTSVKWTMRMDADVCFTAVFAIAAGSGIAMTRVESEQNAELIKEGKIGVIPTDTIYGIVCSALNEVTVERLYKVRGRDARKPCIVLISDAAELAQFGIVVDGALEKALSRVWPGAVSVILDCPSDTFEYLH